MKMVITMDEYNGMKVYELDNATYNRIERELVKAVTYKLATSLLNRWMDKTIKELTCQSYVDIMSMFEVLGE